MLGQRRFGDIILYRTQCSSRDENQVLKGRHVVAMGKTLYFLRDNY